jgi:hypothetical protein
MTLENLSRYCICLSSQAQELNDRGAVFDGVRWTQDDLIRVRFLGGDPSLCRRIQLVAERWIAPGMANLSFNWVDSGDAEIRIAFIQGEGSWSYLGTMCQNVPAQNNPTMNFGWLTPDSDDVEVRRVVLHEFGHALGLIHEHQNPDGGIEWNEPAVINDLKGPPSFWDDATIRRNVLDHYSKDKIRATPADRHSIMMYPIPKSWTLNEFSSDLNSDLSERDIAFIQQVYP